MARSSDIETLMLLGIASYFHDTPKLFKAYLLKRKAQLEKSKSKKLLIELKKYLSLQDPFSFVRDNTALLIYQQYIIAKVVRGTTEYEVTLGGERSQWFNDLTVKEGTVLNVIEYHFRMVMGFQQGCLLITPNPEVGFTGDTYVRWLDGYKSPMPVMPIDPELSAIEFKIAEQIQAA